MKHLFYFFLFSLVSITNSYGCTGLTVQTHQSDTLFARTMEFALNMESNILYIPKNNSFAFASDQNTSSHWQSRYAILGANCFDLPQILEGINEKGLHVGLFYFPGYAQYRGKEQVDAGKIVLAPYELGTYILAHCATIDEVHELLKNVQVVSLVLKQMGISPQVHFNVTDKEGHSIAIEPLNGELKVFKNPVGVMTNSPTFDWHLTNLSNYVNISPFNVPKIDFNHVEIEQLGQGSGMLGLPGDYTPPSRFVRAVMLSKNALKVQSAIEGVVLAWNLINNINIPKGVVIEKAEGDKHTLDYTQWATVSDLTNKKIYFRTYDNPEIRVVDMEKIDPSASEILKFSMKKPVSFTEVSSKESKARPE
jgi:choloylglycine hydrolase